MVYLNLQIELYNDIHAYYLFTRMKSAIYYSSLGIEIQMKLL